MAQAEEIHREIIIILDELVKVVTSRAPKLIEETRGDISTHRLPKNTVNAAISLKTIQLVYNLKAITLLVEHGYFFECDVLMRLVCETSDDLTFLSHGEIHDWTPLHKQFINALYAKDFDEDGNVSEQKVRFVSRGGINEYLKNTVWKGDEDEFSKTNRNVYRLYSASVHGRISGVIRGYYESGEQQFWTGHARNELSMGVQWLMLLTATTAVSNSLVRWICPRWEQECGQDLEDIVLRLNKFIKLGTEVLESVCV